MESNKVSFAMDSPAGSLQRRASSGNFQQMMRKNSSGLFRQDSTTKSHGGQGPMVPLQFVKDNVDKRVRSSELYEDMMKFIPFLVMFLFFFLLGRDIEQNHMTSSATRDMLLYHPFIATSEHMPTMLGLADNATQVSLPLDKQYLDSSRMYDWHDWFKSILIPYTWDCKNPGYSRQTLVNRGQLQYIGAMQIRVMLMRNDSCEPNEEIMPPSLPGLRRECYRGHKRDDEETRNVCNKPNPAYSQEMLWRYRDHDSVSRPVMTTGQRGLYHAGGYVATLPFNATCNQLNEFSNLIGYEDRHNPCNIIDDTRTRFVTVEWFQYSSNADTFLMGKLFFEVQSVGAWIPNFQVRMFPVWTPKRLGQTVFEFFFFVFVLYFLYRVVYDWVVHYRRHKRVLSFIFDVWNLMEVINMVTFIMVFTLRWMWWTQSQNSKIDFPFPPGYPEDLDRLVWLFSFQIYANSVNVVITFLKVLKFIRLNDRLNILTRTLGACQQSIVGVLVLFLFVVLGYAICGTALYGSNIFGFKNINSSFSTLMFMLLGQFDYPLMRKQQPALSGFYFITFICLAFFLLLNFIIAILSDGFAQVSEKTALEPLDQVILRQIAKLQSFFHPKNLKKILELRVKKKSRPELLRQLYTYLQEKYDLIEQSEPEKLDNDYPFYKGNLKDILPETTYNDLGEYYLESLWEDIAHDFHVESKSEDYQQKKDIEEVVGRGVSVVVGTKLKSIEDLDTHVTEVEILVGRIVEILRNLEELGPK